MEYGGSVKVCATARAEWAASKDQQSPTEQTIQQSAHQFSPQRKREIESQSSTKTQRYNPLYRHAFSLKACVLWSLTLRSQAEPLLNRSEHQTNSHSSNDWLQPRRSGPPTSWFQSDLGSTSSLDYCFRTQTHVCFCFRIRVQGALLGTSVLE